MTNEPILELRLRDRRGEKSYSHLDVRIKENGDLSMDGVDGGPEVEKFYGDFDYEYWVTIPAAWRDTVLLHLLKDKFGDSATGSSDFKAWLKERDIKYEFTSWT